MNSDVKPGAIAANADVGIWHKAADADRPSGVLSAPVFLFESLQCRRVGVECFEPQ